jgi:hypothetical protein
MLATGRGDGDGRRSRRDRDDDDRGRARRSDGDRREDGRGAPGAMTLSSSSFDEGGMIPDHFAYNGRNVSPALRWSGVPNAARSLVLIVDDPDAMNFTHWIVYNIPPSLNGLPAGLDAGHQVPRMPGVNQGTNDGPGNLGYYGPEPPPGETHTYRFTLHALDTDINVGPGPDREKIDEMIRGHVIATVVLTGKYGR